MLRRVLSLACSLITLAGTALPALGDYYNRDAGRPTRIEDATSTLRYELEFQLAPLRVDRLASGAHRLVFHQGNRDQGLPARARARERGIRHVQREGVGVRAATTHQRASSSGLLVERAPFPSTVRPRSTRRRRFCARCAVLRRAVMREEQQPFDPLRGVGMRWLAGAGIDHAFALSSTLVTADFVAERFAGLFGRTDLSAELGLRRQVTPQLVLDPGVTRHFVGLLRSNAVSLGVGYGVPTPRIPYRRGEP